MSQFKTRSYQKELMDDLSSAGPEMKQTLHELKIINRLLGGNKVSINALAQFIGAYPQSHYQIADIGCGGGDMIRVMSEWAKKQNISITFHALDANPNIIELAKENLKDLDNVKYHIADVFDEEFGREKVDIITCTLFTHHFTDKELIQMLSGFKLKARLGIIVNDLHRHPLAYYSIKLITGFFSKSAMVKNDGPISVLRSFRKYELKHILKKSGWTQVSIKWNWAFRWQVMARK